MYIKYSHMYVMIQELWRTYLHGGDCFKAIAFYDPSCGKYWSDTA